VGNATFLIYHLRMGKCFSLTVLLLLIHLPVFADGADPGSPGDRSHRQGDEIVVCGQLFHTGTPIVLWTGPGGYDGSRHTGGEIGRPATRPVPGQSFKPEIVRGPRAMLNDVRQEIDQFVLHYDAEGISKQCYTVLERRRLSVQFMLDLDGTVYQCLDLREDAYHATIANSRSIGVEIANIGAWEGPLTLRQKEWYARDASGTRLTIPSRFAGALHVANFAGHPARPNPIGGMVQGRTRLQYDYTPEQYDALAHLAAALCTVFPKIQPDYPRTPAGPHGPYPFAEPDQPGELINHVLPRDQYELYQGLLGHYHVQLDKDDPGPALQWDLLITNTKKLMTPEALAENAKWRHQPAGTVAKPVR
jgi:N-acetylmuramoyl-L-alanine amidase